MPTLIIETNREVGRDAQREVVLAASALVAKVLGKDERWVMVSLRPGATMIHGGSDAPCAYLELKSLGLSVEACEPVAAALCAFAEGALGVPPERVYLEMSAPDPRFFGWNGGTFG